TTARPLPRSRPKIRQFPLSPCSTRRAPLEANRLGLVFDVGEEDRAVLLLQSHLDEGPENDLKAHGQLERGRRLPCQARCPVKEDESCISKCSGRRFSSE